MILIWDVESGKLLHNLQNVGDNVYDAKFSADGRHVFSCGENDGSVRMWDAETGKVVKRFVGHRGLVASLIVSPDGRYLVTFGRGVPDFSARVWDVKTGKEVQQLKGITGFVESAMFLPDSRRILVHQADDRTLRLYDTSTGEEIRRFEKEGAGPASLLSVSHDGQRVLMGYRVRSLWLMDVETGKELHRFDGHTDGVTSAVFLPDGKFALTGSLDKTMRLWRLPDPPAPKGEEKPEVKADPPIIHPLHRIRWPEGGNSSNLNSVDLSHDNRYFAATKIYHAPGGRRIGEVARIWHLETGKFFRELPDTDTVRFTPDEKHVLSFRSNMDLTREADFTLWEVATGKVVRRFGTPITDRWRAVSTVSESGDRVFRETQEPFALQVFDWATGKELCQIDLRPAQPSILLLTQDGRHIIYQAPPALPRRLQVYDASTGKEVNAYPQLRNLQPGIYQILGTGQMLCRDGRNLKIYEVATGKEVCSFDGGLDSWGSLSGDGHRLLATNDRRDEYQVWDVTTRRVIARLRFPESVEGVKRSPRFSVDGQWAAFAGPTDSVYVFRIPLEGNAKDR